jgi:hypothetical protein
MSSRLRPADADKIAAFARAARPVASKAVSLTAGGGPDGHAGRLVEHWRREVAVLTGLTGLGGRFAAAAQDAVSFAVQGSFVLCLCEIAEVTDLRERVRILAATILESRLPDTWQPTGTEGEPAPNDDDADADGLRRRVVELGRQVWSVRRVVRGRHEGRLWHRGLSMVPVVGAAGLLLGERHALSVLAQRTAVELAPTAATRRKR